MTDRTTPRPADRPATFADWMEGARPHTWANAFAPVVAGVGAVFGLMLHFSGLGAPAPDAPPAPTYVGAADAQLK